MGKKPIVSGFRNQRKWKEKNSLPYIKCVLRLSCVVHGPIYDRFMGCFVNYFLSATSKVYLIYVKHNRKTATMNPRGTCIGNPRSHL